MDDLVSLKDGYVLDKATGKPVDIRKPEEEVRQEYEIILHDNYDYEYAQMDIEVKIQRGEAHSKKNEKERADIVIYKTPDKTKRDQNRDILGIIETKRPTKKEGLKQLMSYMSATSCLWGVWTNSKEIEYVYKDPENGELKPDYIFQIPSKGETFEDIGRISKDTLIPAKNLKPIFRRMLFTLYSNTNISRKEKLGSEMVRLLFCKIYDEKYDTDKPPKFKIGFKDSPEDVKKNVVELWKKVRDELSEEGIFGKNEEIVLDPKSIRWIVSELEKYSLTRTDKDVVGDAFEVFAERQFVGEKGEFFTPREVVKMAVQILDPQPKEKILDPACGSGGFLIYALEHIWDYMDKSPHYKGSNLLSLKKDFARKYFYGIDKEIDLVKICKAYMSIVGDGSSNIVTADSLKSPDEWDDIARTTLTENGKIKTYDVIMTNPPFGKNIKVKHDYILKEYDLGHKWKYSEGEGGWKKTNEIKETEPQILFLELCLNLLRDGGRLAIVLPDGMFGNPTDGYIREWIKDKAEILAVIDCSHNTFMPYTHTKTSVLILKKWGKTRQKNYPIMMSIVEKCGHDTRGKEIYKKNEEDEEILDEEFSKATEIYKKNLNRVIKGFDRLGFTLYEGNLVNGILIPRYYDPDIVKEIERLKQSGKYELKSIQNLIDEGVLQVKGAGASVSSAEYNIYDTVPFLRTSDIGAWETRNYAVQNVNELTYSKYKDKQDLQIGDILFIKDGTYRIGEVIILTEYDLKMLVQSHFLRIRCLDKNRLDPYLFLYLLHAPIVRKQIDEKTFVQATISTIGDRLTEVFIPIPKDESMKKGIAKDMREKLLNRAKLRVEINTILHLT